MKIQQVVLVAATLAATCVLNLSAFAQGALTPPGAPAPTMKTLDQVEARTAITNTSSLVTISQPGSYYLTHNLTVSAGDGIDINTNGVTLDLNGFTIRSTAANATGNGIFLAGSAGGDITIYNGHIRGSVTNNGSGVYSGGGFGSGINYYGVPPQNILVSRITVSGCLYDGIYLYANNSTVVEACTVRTVGSYGIFAATVKSCLAMDCWSTAIYCNQVSDSRGQSPGVGSGISADVAQNCYGQSDGSGNAGVSADTAQNCYGYSSMGEGISATTTQNCYGYSSSGYGISATTAQNCFGYSSSGDGIYASITATDCSGYSNSGTGLYAFIANICHGATSSGTALSTTHNVNSY